jgi:hypothetical protein
MKKSKKIKLSLSFMDVTVGASSMWIKIKL